VNKERLYANFGNKERLYDTVMEMELRRVRETTPLLLDAGEGVGEFVRRVFEINRRDPSLVRILMWEAMSYEERGLMGDGSRREFYRERVAGIQEKLGIADRDRAAMVYFVLVGLALWSTAMPNLAHLMTDGAMDTEDGLGRLEEYIVELSERLVPKGSGA
jgi:AcrR family transcriptional regulator